MNREIFKEAFKVVDKINEEAREIFEEEFGLCFPLLYLTTNGDYIIISLFDKFQIWFNDEDEREFDEEKNDWEPLEGFVRREVQKIIYQISKVTLCSLTSLK